MNNEVMAMTLEQMRDEMRSCVSPLDGYHSPKFQRWADAIDAHLTQPTPVVDAMFTDNEVSALALFANDVIGDWPNVASLDGFELQELAEKRGLIRAEQRGAPCGEVCNCAAEVGEFPVTCYRATPLLQKAHAVARATC